MRRETNCLILREREQSQEKKSKKRTLFENYTVLETKKKPQWKKKDQAKSESKTQVNNSDREKGRKSKKERHSFILSQGKKELEKEKTKGQAKKGVRRMPRR